MRSTSSYYHLCILIILSVTFVSAQPTNNALVVPRDSPVRGIDIIDVSGALLQQCDVLFTFIDMFHIPTIDRVAIMSQTGINIIDPHTCERFRIASNGGTIPFFSAGGFFDAATGETYLMNEDSISLYDFEAGTVKFHCSLSGVSATAGVVVNNILYIGDDNRTFHEISGFQNQDCSITASSEQITSNIPGTPDNMFFIDDMTALDSSTILVDAAAGFRQLSVPDLTITVVEPQLAPGQRVMASMLFIDNALATGRDDFGFDIRSVLDVDTVVTGCTNTALLEPAKAMSFSPQLRSVMYLTDKSLFAVNAFNCEIVKSCDVPSIYDGIMVDEQTGDVFVTAKNRRFAEFDMDTCSSITDQCLLKNDVNYGALRNGELFSGSESFLRPNSRFTQGVCGVTGPNLIDFECDIQELTFFSDTELAYSCDDGRIHKIEIETSVSTLLTTVGTTTTAITVFPFRPAL